MTRHLRLYQLLKMKKTEKSKFKYQTEVIPFSLEKNYMYSLQRDSL